MGAARGRTSAVGSTETISGRMSRRLCKLSDVCRFVRFGLTCLTSLFVPSRKWGVFSSCFIVLCLRCRVVGREEGRSEWQGERAFPVVGKPFWPRSCYRRLAVRAGNIFRRCFSHERTYHAIIGKRGAVSYFHLPTVSTMHDRNIPHPIQSAKYVVVSR